MPSAIGTLSAILLDMPGKRKRSITPLMVGHRLDEQDAFDRTTEHFLTEGEEHEARGWEDVLPLDDEPGMRPRRGSVDKVPRRRGAVVAVVALCVCLVLAAAAGGFALFAKGRVGEPMATIRAWLSVTSRESTAVRPPNPKSPQTPRQTNTPSLGPALAPSPAMPQVPAAAPPASEAVAIPAKGLRPEDKTEHGTTPLPDLEGQERLRKDALATRRRRHRGQAQDDYVWSAELNALVHASSLPSVAQPSAQSDAATGRHPASQSPR